MTVFKGRVVPATIAIGCDTDPTEPEFWECEIGEDGERYCYPKELGQPGFFEDYFDGDEATRTRFWALYGQLYEGAEPRRGAGN